MSDSRRQSPFGIRARLRKALSREPASAPTGPARVRFEGGPEGEVEAGTTVLDAARALGMTVTSYCGGFCSCGTCRVEILSGAEQLSAMQGNEQMVLGASNVAKGNRLACQAKLQGQVEVRVPDWF